MDQDVQVVAEAFLLLDFPRLGENVSSCQYTLRLSAPACIPAVEVSIDEGDWQPARFSVGHWWYDWSAYGPGEHRLRARALTPENRQIVLERFCLVEPLE